MNPSLVASDWFKHPLAEAVLRFQLLPSMLLHPARESPVGRPHLESFPLSHRHLSAAMLEQFGIEPTMSLDDPALPLAMLPNPQFDKMQLLLGAALNANHIRRTISREAVTQLKTQLCTEALAVVRTPLARRLGPMGGAPGWDIANAAELCMSWGAAVFALAFDAATPSVRARAMLRLPPGSESRRDDLSVAGIQPESALLGARELLQSVEPAWLSSFPTMR